MNRREISEPINCSYVAFKAKLSDGRSIKWSELVPNRDIDELLGISPEGNYPAADQFGTDSSRIYMQGGIRLCNEQREHEFIKADLIAEISTVVETKCRTIGEIMMSAADFPLAQGVIANQPGRQQEAIDALNKMLNGQATLNELLSKLGLPPRNEPAANSLLKPTDAGFESVSDGKPLDILPLIQDDTIRSVVQIRRAQVLRGISEAEACAPRKSCA